MHSQSKYPSFLTIHKNSNWNIKVDTISESKFDYSKVQKYNPQESKINWDSILKLKAMEFPESISLTDSCAILNGFNKKIQLCQRRPPNERQWTDFKLFDIKNDYLTFNKSGYEWWNIISFNPSTRKYYSTFHLPVFINSDLVYSYGNYYAEGQFQIIDNKNNRYFGFETFNWELTKLYKIDTLFYIELINNKSRSKKRYLRLTYE